VNVSKARWIKSSYSGPEQGNCLEIAPDFVGTHGVMPVRDSKCPEGEILSFTPSAYAAFVTAARSGAFSK
jgi:hypothetical protein